ncbi:MAG: phosphoribosylformylglycinamidine synthase, partial [Patescibacteria group bacterium]|nr:phosphoribosylformylglycinamidine synthase [Patescibacteria group bacterium]
MLWEVDIYPAEGQPDLPAQQVAHEAPDAGLPADMQVRVARGYLVQGPLDRAQVERIARELLADPVVERTLVAPAGDPALMTPPEEGMEAVHVLPKPGVMDPVAQSALEAIADFGVPAEAVRTVKKYWIAGVPEALREQLYWKLLANDAVEQVV